METLKDYNLRIFNKWRKFMGQKTGVLCPQCGNELIYIRNDGVLYFKDGGNIPYRSAMCDCGYRIDLIQE